MICDSLGDSRAGFRLSCYVGACGRVCVCVSEGLSLRVCVGGASFNALLALTRVSSPSVIVVVAAVLETRGKRHVAALKWADVLKSRAWQLSSLPKWSC